MSQELLQDRLRSIPGVDQILLQPAVNAWITKTSRGFVIGEIQRLLEDVRKAIRAGDRSFEKRVDPGQLVVALEDRIKLHLRPALRPVINATGVILHTNLGRAPLSAAAQQSLSAVSARYTNLEYDLAAGGRSHRDRVLETLLPEVLGCESAAVVNNNAAAVFLILNTLAAGREVIVSRGELVEIGGSFRIPDIMARSGAVLREVGTTNKTCIEDYASAIGPGTALLLRIHPSNYRIRGFTHRPALDELVQLAHDRQLPLVEDIGSGCLLDLARFGIEGEPVARESIAAGASLVCFSADKLLGGPQAGIIAGERRWIEEIRRNPLMRTFRVEKLIYGALEATLSSYRSGRALSEIPVLRMISAGLEDLEARAAAFLERLTPRLPGGAKASLMEGSSVVGGGSCPDSSLPTRLIALEPGRRTVNDLEAALRGQDPPKIVRIEGDRVLVDLRTVFPDEEDALLEGLCRSLSDPGAGTAV
jgi:L-seryl-tRNA(Ser) seleniumtransferase